MRTRTKKTVHYTHAPKLFMDMRDHLDAKNDEKENPFETCDEADIFVMDFVRPEAAVARAVGRVVHGARGHDALLTPLSSEAHGAHVAREPQRALGVFRLLLLLRDR